MFVELASVPQIKDAATHKIPGLRKSVVLTVVGGCVHKLAGQIKFALEVFVGIVYAVRTPYDAMEILSKNATLLA